MPCKAMQGFTFIHASTGTSPTGSCRGMHHRRAASSSEGHFEPTLESEKAWPRCSRPFM